MVRSQHPVGMARGGDALLVDDSPGRFIDDAPAGPVQSPAQVHVLDVHEIGLVETAHRLEGFTPHEKPGARHPVGVPGPVLIVTDQPVPARPGVVTPKQPDKAMPESVAEPGEGATRGVAEPSGSKSIGPAIATSGRRSNTAARREMVPGSTTRSGLHMKTSSPPLASAPMFAPAPYPRFRGGLSTFAGTSSVPRFDLAPSLGPLSTTTMFVTPLSCRLVTHRTSTSPAS